MDELERVRRLADGAPAPDPARKEAARDGLLAMAAAEEARLAQQEGQADRPAAARAWLRGLLVPRWVPAVAAALILVVAIGGVLLRPWSTPGDGQPDGTIAADPPPASGPDPGSAEPGDDGVSATPDATPELASRCSDPEGHYTIGYADGWHTEPDGACQRFDQEPVELDAAIGGPDPLTPVTIQVVDLAFGALTDPPPVDWHEEEAEATTIDGRPAVRAVWVSTGDGALEAGRTSYRYLVDLGDRTLIAETRDPEDGSFDRLRDVLDRMMATIELSGDD